MENRPPARDDPRACLAASDAARVRGDHRNGASLARQAMALAEAQGDLALAGEAGALLALHQLRLGGVDDAVACSHQALGRLADGGPTAALSRAHSTLSMAHERADLRKLALSHAAMALQIARA